MSNGGSLGRLNVIIGAATSGLDQAARTSGRILKGLGSEVNATRQQLFSLRNVVTGVGAGIALNLVRRAAEAVEQQSKLASAINGTTKSVQTLERAAQLAGVSKQVLIDGAKNLDQTLSKLAKTGSGPAREALNTLGIDLKEIQNLDADQRLALIGERIKELGLSGDQAVKVMKGLGFQSAEIAKIFADGGTAIRQAGKDVEDFGIAVSEVDAEKLRMANEAMKTLGQSFQGFMNNLAVRFAPVITAVSNGLADAARESEGFKREVELAFKVGIWAAGQFLNALHGIRIAQNSIAGLYIKEQEIRSRNLANRMKEETFFTRFESAEARARRMARVAELENTAEAASMAFEQAHAEWKGLVDGPQPSEKLSEDIKNAEVALNEAAAAAAETRRQQDELIRGIAGGWSEDGEGGGGSSEEKERERMEAQLERFRESLRTMEESEIASHERRLEELNLFNEGKLLSEAEYNELLEKEKARHEKAMSDIQAQEADARKKIEQDLQKMRQQTVTLAIGLLDQFAGKSKAAAIAAIALNKGLMISQTIQNTAAAAMAAVAPPPLGLGPVAGAPLAAKVKAMGAIQVGIIAATGLAQAAGSGGGGGGDVSTTGYSGGVPVQNTQNQQTGGGPSNFLDVSLSGVNASDMFTGEQIRGLIDKINEQIGDGAVIRNIRFA